MQIVVRPAVQDDLPALLELYAELHPADPPLATHTATEVWRAVEAQAGRTILVAEAGAALAGTIDCTVLPNFTRAARPFMLVENVVVSAGYRRAGVGTALMEAAVRLARQAGCYKVQLLSRTDRKGAHAFYEARGFRAAAQGYRLYFD
ncbi:acetyltransferase [Virgisporangium aliadipatigenens]|uniref:Acetyltransferase n=1 Tax=Virgisporangium aliadipatigenens TaxID=741659 RepID=A0A8J3YKK6_9ACTN|nr:GNAT family N-acetyltransferase [Virgisporangium aliadipatigenens]GIJ47144.1 acetyltransferase [Virgisporangium aliadipatigenens]